MKGPLVRGALGQVSDYSPGSFFNSKMLFILCFQKQKAEIEKNYLNVDILHIQFFLS